VEGKIMDSINNTQSSGISSLSLTPEALGGGSLQMMFAQLQMQLCAQSKTNAMGYMDQIKATQEEQKEVSDFLQQARKAQAEAKDNKCCTNMSEDMWKYMEANDLAYDKKAAGQDTPFQYTGSATDRMAQAAQGYNGGKNCDGQPGWTLKDGFYKCKDGTYTDLANDKDQWDTAITSLQQRLDSLGTDTQQKMVYVQDFMGQYNSYLQGANSTIQQSNQTLNQLAKVQ
jgi:hypothetical protein